MTGDRLGRPRNLGLASRRDLLGLALRTAGAAALTPSVLGLCCRRALAQSAGVPSQDKKLILLWLGGGPCQFSTFDPKPGSPNQGSIGSIPTDIPGVQFGEHLPQLAQRVSDLAVVRTLTSKEGSHSRARELLHTGHTPNPAVDFPTLGSIVAYEVGDLDHDLPAFVQVDGPLVNRSYLGVAAAPFRVVDPTGKIANLTTPVTTPILEGREELRGILDEHFARQADPSAVRADAVQRQRALRLMNSKLVTAFDLNQESDTLRNAYGRTRFGQGALLARRLVQNGVSAVEVVLDGWDTHADHTARTTALCQQLDPAFATLIDDLKEHDLLDNTLVVCMGEFGRTPRITRNDGRGHWPHNYCVTMAGGGIQAGTVLGTTDETGEKLVERPVSVPDLFATISHLLGIDGSKLFNEDSRPVTLVDPAGSVVSELLNG